VLLFELHVSIFSGRRRIRGDLGGGGFLFY